MLLKNVNLAFAIAAGLMCAAASQAEAQQLNIMQRAEKKDWATNDVAQRWIMEFNPDSPVALTYQSYKVGTRVVTVYIGQSLACDNGPNSSTTSQFWSTCPMNVVWQDGVKSVTRTIPNACFAFLGEGDPDPQRNGTFTRYDAASRAIIVETLQDGKPVPQCTQSIKVD